MLASGLAVISSIEFSISATLWCGAVSYFFLGPISVMLSSQLRLLNTTEAKGRRWRRA